MEKFLSHDTAMISQQASKRSLLHMMTAPGCLATTGVVCAGTYGMGISINHHAQPLPLSLKGMFSNKS